MMQNNHLSKRKENKNMKCRDCKWMYTNETMDELYICVNGNCDNFGEYTGICCEDECEDGEEY